MRERFAFEWLAPVAALVAAPAYAATYFTVPGAQAALFPGETMTPVAVALTADQVKAIEKASGTKVRDKAPKVWRASGGGWFYLDQVIGKHEFITYAVALTADGAVQGVEILDYRETYGSEVRHPKWRAQFVGKRVGAPLKLDVDIVNLSGATLSSRNVTTGVRRLLVMHAQVVSHL
jgi:Na+-translocating ferredoxin:NAD+ oxidoreductase RnfG subunit